MSEHKEEKNSYKDVKNFTVFMQKFGINLVQFYAYASTNGGVGTFEIEEPMQGAIIENEDFCLENLNMCWYGENSIGGSYLKTLLR